MTAVSAPPAARIAGPVRDRSIDVVRSASLVLVVLLHATMVGVTISDGEPVFANALETDWFAPVSWFVQMMPLFFIAGGFTAIGSWRRARERGRSPAHFISGRVTRLMRPAIALFAVVAVGLGLLAFAGVPPDVVATAGFHISQPLWFLGVFVLVQALVPAMAAAHERSPMLALGVPLASVAAVDAVRFATGWEAVGFLNLALVWLFVQQLGFWHADGFINRMTVGIRITAVAVIGAVLASLVAYGPYVPDMYVNLNPPTLLLAVFGIGQALLLSLATPWLRRVAQRPVIAFATDWIGARAMTAYLWHMPVLIGLAGLSLLGALSGAMTLPELHTAAWWVTRPLWLAIAVIVVAVVVAAVTRFERGDRADPSGAPWLAAGGAVMGVWCVVTMFVLGLGSESAALCALLAASAAALAGDFPRQKRQAAAIARRFAAGQAGDMTAERGVHA